MILFDPLAIRDVVIAVISAIAGFLSAIFSIFKRKGQS